MSDGSRAQVHKTPGIAEPDMWELRPFRNCSPQQSCAERRRCSKRLLGVPAYPCASQLGGRAHPSLASQPPPRRLGRRVHACLDWRPLRRHQRHGPGQEAVRQPPNTEPLKGLAKADQTPSMVTLALTGENWCSRRSARLPPRTIQEWLPPDRKSVV